jgi:hypothetical protein
MQFALFLSKEIVANGLHVRGESKKGPLYFCQYLTEILTNFQSFFNIELRINCTTKQLLHFKTNSERVATISCEIINCTIDVIFDRR